MSILMDYNQIFISNIIQNPNIDEDLLRHMVLNTIRMYNIKFKSKFGNLIICCDDRYSWRRDYFKYYKANRKKHRKKSPLDWNFIFQSLEKIRNEVKENFNYRILHIKTAEADDIIGVLSKNLSPTENIVIVSSDKDFMQLQRYDNVSQYCPLKKTFVDCENPLDFLKEHIMRGDFGDGIPNFLSADDCLVEEIRQTPLSKRKVNVWTDIDPSIFCDRKMLKGYERNKKIIDLDLIPTKLHDNIMQQYESYQFPNSSNLLDYFIDNRLNKLIEAIGDF